MNEQIPPEDYDTEEKPKRQRKETNTYRTKKSSKPAEFKSFSEGFWTAFFWTLGIPLAIFWTLALIGGFLK